MPQPTVISHQSSSIRISSDKDGAFKLLEEGRRQRAAMLKELFRRGLNPRRKSKRRIDGGVLDPCSMIVTGFLTGSSIPN